MTFLRLLILLAALASLGHWLADVLTCPRNYIYYGEPST